MPKIPQYRSSKAPALNISPARVSPAEAGVAGQLKQKTGETLDKISDQFKNLRILQETTAAATDANKQLEQLQLEAQQDPDVYNTDKYKAKISELRTKTVGSISDGETALKFSGQFDASADRAFFNIQKDARNRQIDLAKTSLLGSLDVSEGQYRAAATPQEKFQIKAEMDKRIDDFALAGVLTREAAFELKGKQKKALVVSEVNQDMRTDPAATIERLKAGWYEQGIGEQLDPDTKNKLLDSAQKYVDKVTKEQDRAMKVAQDKNEADIALAASKNEMDLNTLQEALQQGKISTTFFQQMEKALTTETKAPESARSSAFVQLNERYLSMKLDEKGFAEGNDLAQIRKFREDVIAARNQGLIDAPDFQSWIAKTTPDYLEAIKPKTSFLKAAMQNLKSAVLILGGGGTMAAGMIRNLMTRSENAKASEIPQIANEIIQEEQRKISPELSSLDKTPSQIMDKNGIAKRTYTPPKSTPTGEKYQVGDIIPVRGKDWKVVGFDNDGEPLLDEVRDAGTP